MAGSYPDEAGRDLGTSPFFNLRFGCYRVGISHTGFLPWISFMILYEVNKL